MSAEATSAGLPKAGEQLPKRSAGPFDAEALLRYARVSGDDNPLHLDPDLARRAGLAAPPIHGMLILAHFEPMIRAWRTDFSIISLSGKFLRPVLAGQIFEMSGKVARVTAGAEASIILRLMAHAPGNELALLAEAKLAPRGLGFEPPHVQ